MGWNHQLEIYGNFEEMFYKSALFFLNDPCWILSMDFSVIACQHFDGPKQLEKHDRKWRF